MGGRFHICPQLGAEINTNNLEQVLKFSFGDEIKKQKYPLVLMLPPSSTGDYLNPHFKDEYEITLFFLATTFYTSHNQVQSPNPNTNTSQHTILEYWHDMKRCAIQFLKALQSVAPVPGGKFFIKEGFTPVIDPVSLIGNDRVSGVKLTFNFFITEDCSVEDYPEDFEAQFQRPEGVDIHPEHLL
jgi:hypothetical protein